MPQNFSYLIDEEWNKNDKTLNITILNLMLCFNFRNVIKMSDNGIKAHTTIIKFVWYATTQPFRALATCHQINTIYYQNYCNSLKSYF